MRRHGGKHSAAEGYGERGLRVRLRPDGRLTAAEYVGVRSERGTDSAAERGATRDAERWRRVRSRPSLRSRESRCGELGAGDKPRARELDGVAAAHEVVRILSELVGQVPPHAVALG